MNTFELRTEDAPSTVVEVQPSAFHDDGQGAFLSVNMHGYRGAAWLSVAEVESVIDALADAVQRADLRVRRPLVEGKRYVVLAGVVSGDGTSHYRLSEGDVVTLDDRDPDPDGDVCVETADGLRAWCLPQYLAPATTEENDQ